MKVFKCALHPTPEGQNLHYVPVQGQNLHYVPVQGQNFKMITSAKHAARLTRDTFQFGPECVARVFQTLFIMREEGVMLYKDKRAG